MEKYLFEKGKDSDTNGRDNLSLFYGEDRKGNPAKTIYFHDGKHSGRGSSCWEVFGWVQEPDRQPEWWAGHTAKDARVISALKKAGIDPNDPFDRFDEMYKGGFNYA